MHHSEQYEIKKKAVDALEVSIATKDDIIKSLTLLRRPLGDILNQEVHQALVAIDELSRISRLSAALAQFNTQRELLAFLKKLLFSEPADIVKRSILIRCCLSTISNVSIGGGTASNCELVLLKLLKYGKSERFKSVVDNQLEIGRGRDSNSYHKSLVDLLNCMATISKAAKLQKITTFVEAIIEIMTSFQNDNDVVIACLKVLIIPVSEPRGACSFLSLGGINLIAHYVKKFLLCEEVQVASLELWAATLEAGPKEANADALRKVDAVNVLESIKRVHLNSKPIKRELLSIYSALMCFGMTEPNFNDAINLLDESIEVSYTYCASDNNP